MTQDIHITRVQLPDGGEEMRRMRIINQNFEQLRDQIERLKASNGFVDSTLISHGDLDDLLLDDHTLYHTDARALVWLGTRSTTDLPEGTNLYWTDARFDTRFALQETLQGIASVATGDITYYDGAAWARLAAGTNGHVLTLTAGVPVWAAAAGGGLPSGTQGDLLYYNGTAWVVLGAGTSGHYLKTLGTGANPAWAAVSGGSIPLTTKGDLYGYDTAGNRIPVGTDDQVLTADSAAALGVSWKAGGSGGGGSPPDDFDLLTDGVDELIFVGGDVLWVLY